MIREGFEITNSFQTSDGVANCWSHVISEALLATS